MYSNIEFSRENSEDIAKNNEYFINSLKDGRWKMEDGRK